MPDFTEDIVWKAVYKDGSVLWEKDANGREHKFSEIRKDQLKEFHLMKPSDKIEDFYKDEYAFVTTMSEDKKQRVEVKFNILQDNIDPVLSVILDGNKRLIFTRRVRKMEGQKLVLIGKWKVPIPTKKTNRLIIVGWQDTIGGKNVQAINFIYPNGKIELSGEWKTDADHGAVNT